MKKTIYTLDVDGYAPDIVELTRPLLERYAKKIGADLHVINTRKWPDAPPVYEKLQIFELAQQHDNDWNIFFDADALIHPDAPDLTNLLPQDTVANNWYDFAPNRWAYRDDRNFLRDGRHIGCGNWLAVASRLCIDYWHPLDDLSIEDAVARIYPIQAERLNGVSAEHLIDDFTCSRNIAKYGLKYTTIRGWLKDHKDGIANGDYFWHEYLLTRAEKVQSIRATLMRWRL